MVKRHALGEVIWCLDDLLENFEGMTWIAKAGDVARLKTKFWEISDKGRGADMSISCQLLDVIRLEEVIKLRKGGVFEGGPDDSVMVMFDKMVEEVEGRLAEIESTCCADASPG